MWRKPPGSAHNLQFTRQLHSAYSFCFKALQSRTPCSGIDYSMAKNVCQERSAKSQPVCILCRTGCRPVKLCILKFYLISRCIFCKESQSLYSSYSSPSSAAMNCGTALGSMPRMYANSLCSRFCASCKARSSKAESPLPWALRAWCWAWMSRTIRSSR